MSFYCFYFFLDSQMVTHHKLNYYVPTYYNFAHYIYFVSQIIYLYLKFNPRQPIEWQLFLLYLVLVMSRGF